MLKKILMHSNDKVLTYTENTKGYVEEVCNVYNTRLLPFQCKATEHYVFKLQRWLLENKASLNRRDINTFASFYGKDFITPPNFVSLLNNYWIRTEKDLTTTWDNVNPYDNWNMDEDIINILVHAPYMLYEGNQINYNSPNMTIPGQKERYWLKEDNNFYLLEPKTKKSTFPLTIYEQTLYSKRTIPFINKDYELIPFSFYYESITEDNLTELEKIKMTAEKYQLDKTQLCIGHFSDTYIVREEKSLQIMDVITL